MAFFKIDSDFWRRLRFYGFGLLMGCMLVSVITKGKACRMPGTLKMEELYSQDLKYSAQGNCWMACEGISSEQLKKILKGGSVNYSKSDVHARPYPLYAVDAEFPGNKHMRLIIADCADTSKIISLSSLDSQRDSCGCLP